ncbi:Alpha/Beta hydrolase protein [Triangularia verruculosa]|uniref:sn-1-specific diacylglycerol lipase n=1 Tax=Triangularia verruculosa TaxID=2587418 RepID=A0AAN7AXF5_9PEZI|nr:Alpha/Beta hydrolase protein [Triangularia verruculosa]
MAWLRNTFRRRAVRVAAHSAASASASIPDCNMATAQASLAASAAAADLTAGLDFIFDRLAYQGDKISDEIQYHLEQLCEHAERYLDSSIHDNIGEQWSCSPGTSELIRAACQCAVMVYDQTQEIGVKGFDVEPVLHRSPSFMGNVKACSMWKIPFTPIPGWRGKTLVISIRGTATAFDHMVNMNGKAMDASNLFQINSKGQPFNVQAHAGFLACAQDMAPIITEDIKYQLLADKEIYNLVFTGHSAGGAVASLLFLHHLFHQSPTQRMNCKLSLITFGSPPVLSRGLTDICKENDGVGLLLSIVNEYDMISRADGPYLRSLIDLYRSRYGLPSVSGSATTRGHSAWPLPLPVFQPLGDIIILKLHLVDIPSFRKRDSSSQASTLMAPTLKAVKVSPEEFARLLFCDISTHRRRSYMERVDMLVAELGM